MESVNDVAKFETSILNLNTPTRNGRVFTREAIQKALEDVVAKEKLEYGLFPIVCSDGLETGADEYGNIDLKKVVGNVDGLVITDDNKLYVSGVIFNPEAAERFTDLEFTTIGTGNLTPDKDGTSVVSDYKLIGIRVSQRGK